MSKRKSKSKVSHGFKHRRMVQLVQDLVKGSDGKFTAASFCRKLGVAQTVYYRWANGKGQPNCESLYKICRTLHVSSDWLLGL